MVTQKEIDNTCINNALEWAKLSKATRAKVGAIIYKDGVTIAEAFNGTFSGFDNTCEDNLGLTKPEVLHAELNAIAKAACNVVSTVDATIYITINPCQHCAKLIIASRIKRVVYKDIYNQLDLSVTSQWFGQAGICFERLSDASF